MADIEILPRVDIEIIFADQDPRLSTVGYQCMLFGLYLRKCAFFYCLNTRLTLLVLGPSTKQNRLNVSLKLGIQACVSSIQSRSMKFNMYPNSFAADGMGAFLSISHRYVH